MSEYYEICGEELDLDDEEYGVCKKCKKTQEEDEEYEREEDYIDPGIT